MGTDGRGAKTLLGVLILVILIGTVLGGTLVGPGMMGPRMMWGYGNPAAAPIGGGWMWGLTMGVGMLLMLAFWGALIVGAALLIRWAVGQSRDASSSARFDEPEEILRRRYAAGEIDQATYQQMKADLEDEPARHPREKVGANGTRG